MNFQGKTALITGAAVGIGRAVAIKLAGQGASLALVDVNEQGLASLKQELAEYGTSVYCYTCDVSDEARVRAVCDEAMGDLGKIDILVNNAALWRYHENFLDTPIEIWKRFNDINVMGTVYFTHALLGQMLERGWGRIINVCSVAGVYGLAKMVPYSATKGAVIAMSKALAKEVADKGVLVNAVSPGSVSTSANPDVNHTDPSDLPFMGRTGSDMENANLICFLASEEASYIAGQSIQIDGCRRRI